MQDNSRKFINLLNVRGSEHKLVGKGTPTRSMNIKPPTNNDDSTVYDFLSKKEKGKVKIKKEN